MAVGLVLTYQATGVFNFAFGAQAFAAAFVFTILTQNEHWSGFPAFVVTVVVMSPLVGLAFDRLLFRHIPNSNSMAKVVCSLCLFVGIPSLMTVIFGAQNLDATATILPFFNPNVVYFSLFGTPINGIYLSTITVTLVVLVALTALLRYTNLGLQMRGAVESRRLVQLDGVNSGGVVAIAWVISSFMAGLAGVLLAPTYGNFQASDYAALDGGRHRRRGLGTVAVDPHRHRRGRPHGGGQHDDAGLSAHREPLVLGRHPGAPVLLPGGRAPHPARDADARPE